MSDSIFVHNPSSTARVVTAQGHILSAFRTREVPADDHVARRLLSTGRLLDVTHLHRPEPVEVSMPSGNGTRDEWVAYAVTQGWDHEDLESLKRNEIRDMFVEEDSDQDPPVEGDTSTDQGTEATADGEPDSTDDEKE